ncbi:MAG: hypothetical protein NDJ94_24205 [Vicinamibacteria bacterium]|nr:hypothetical protein [Vicinamibacteria bacterium]
MELHEPTEVLDLSDQATRAALAELARRKEAPSGCIRKAYAASEVKAVEGAGRQLAWIVSTADVDRDGDVVDPKGGDWSPWLKGGGPVLWAHNYRIPPYNIPVANGISMELVAGGKALRSVADFGEPGVWEFGDLIYELCRPRENGQPRLRQASIGFLTQEWSYDEERGGFNVVKYEGLEWSIVPIASNRESLSEAKALGTDLRPLVKWAELVLDGAGEERLTRKDLADVFAALKLATTREQVAVPAAPVEPVVLSEAQVRKAIRDTTQELVSAQVRRLTGRLD